MTLYSFVLFIHVVSAMGLFEASLWRVLFPFASALPKMPSNCNSLLGHSTFCAGFLFRRLAAFCWAVCTWPPSTEAEHSGFRSPSSPRSLLCSSVGSSLAGK